MADRESDIYEVFDVCGKQSVDYVVRAQHSRALEGEDRALFDVVGRQPVLGKFQMELRARSTSPARTVTLVVRAMRVNIRGPWRPGGRVAELPLNVVDVRAIDQNPQDPPIHWVLLTSLPTDGFAAVVKIIRIYAARWLVEEYHKALKTGVRIEQSQLSQAHRIEALLAVLTVVAARLLDLKLLAATKADTPLSRARSIRMRCVYWKRWPANPPAAGPMARSWSRPPAWADSLRARGMAIRGG